MHKKIEASIVQNGVATSIIVLPANPSPAAEEGAKILSDHLTQISGAQVETLKETDLKDVRIEDGKIVTSSKDDVETFILVGEGELTQKLGVTSEDLGPGGIIIKTTGNALVILGADKKRPSDTSSDPWGTRYAVTQFLEDYLGVKYLWPGELGKVVPNNETIAIPNIDLSFTPPIAQRHFRSFNYSNLAQQGLDNLGFTKEEFLNMREEAANTESQTPTWFTWHRLGGKLGLSGRHAYLHLWDKYGEEHPEWFALQPDGSRDQSAAPDRTRLCKSNLDLIDAIAKEKIEELDNNPGQRSVSISPNDNGPQRFCMCPECKKLDPQDGPKVTLWETVDGKRRNFEYVSLTDRMVYFYNAIAERVTEKHPDAILVAYAYSRYKTPPMWHELHPNIVIGFASMGYETESARLECLDNWDGWAAMATQIFWRPNLLWFRNDGTASVFVHRAAEDLRYLLRNRMIGTDQDCCMHHWATQGLNYYVFAKLHWNPYLHVDRLIDDYCKSGFGAAWKGIKKYFMRMEHLSNEWAFDGKDYPTSYTPEVVNELNGILDAAKEVAGDDEIVRKRIEFLQMGLNWSAVEGKLQRMLAKLQASEEIDKEKAHSLLQSRYELMSDIFKNNHYAINVTAWAALFGKRLSKLFGWEAPEAVTSNVKKEIVTDGEGEVL